MFIKFTRYGPKDFFLKKSRKFTADFSELPDTCMGYATSISPSSDINEDRLEITHMREEPDLFKDVSVELNIFTGKKSPRPFSALMTSRDR